MKADVGGGEVELRLLVQDGKWPMESRGWKMKAVPGDGRTLKMELLPNILFTLAMLAIGEFEELRFNKNGIPEDQEYLQNCCSNVTHQR